MDAVGLWKLAASAHRVNAEAESGTRSQKAWLEQPRDPMSQAGVRLPALACSATQTSEKSSICENTSNMTELTHIIQHYLK